MNSPETFIRVLVVEDSATARELLVHVLNSDPAIQVIGIASNGEEGLAAAKRLRPDVITMDMHLPGMDGFATTRKIMETCPTRIIMVTSSSVPHQVVESFHTLEAGALAVLARPLGIYHPDYQATAKVLVDTVKLMAEVKVVKRWAHAAKTIMTQTEFLTTSEEKMKKKAELKIVAIGASTGGPLVLQEILSSLPKNFPVPILIVQHISNGFVNGFAEWLGQTTNYPVQVATHGIQVQPGIAYMAPDDRHMIITENNTIALSDEMNEYGLRPSISCLFRSVNKEYSVHAIGVLLTGMGRDGAKELLKMRQAGAITIAQNEESCVVYGMPGEAVKLNAAIHVLAPVDIAKTLKHLVMGGHCAQYKEGVS